jgi:hypothetical protein
MESYDYLKSTMDSDPNSHIYMALGTPFHDKKRNEQRRPMADMGVYFTPKMYDVPFSNENAIRHNRLDRKNITGLSDYYLQTVKQSIEGKDEDDWTGHDDDAMQILDNTYSLNPDEKFVKEKMEGNIHFHPQKLFTEVPSSITIGSMFSDPSMTHSAMTLAAIAKRDLGAEKIIASDSLSPYSSKLTRNAIKKGLPVEPNMANPKAKVTNANTMNPRSVSMESDEEFHDDIGGPIQAIPHEQVKAARQDLRDMLRANRPVRNNTPVTPKGLSAQFLPGMEGFV